jgi:Protein O-mannosyl-transferase TMEM260-like
METRTFPTCRLVGILLILAFAILYLLTLDNGLRPGELEGGDLITHQYAQAQGRPSNAPGYPLYTMGGWLWFHLGRAILGPGYNPIPILSSYSTLWALLALWLLYWLILEVTDRDDGGNWPVAVLVTAFYGVTYFFWYYAVTTEQYTSAVAWTLAVIYLAFLWERKHLDRTLLAIALLVGVGLSHMVTVLFIVLPLLWFLLGAEPRLLRRPRLIAAAIGVAILPLLSYAFVYFTGAAHPEWQGAGQWPSTWRWFWSFLSTRQGRSELTWSLAPFLTAEFPALMWREMTWPGLVFGLGGLAALGRRRAIFLYSTLAIYLVFSWVDRLGNWYQVVMPVYAILTVGIAGTADWAWRHLGFRTPVIAPERPGSRELERSPGSRDSAGASVSDRGFGGRAGEQGSRRAREQAGARSPRLPHGASLALPVLVVALLGTLVVYRGVRSYPLADSSNRLGDTGLAPGWAILADQPPAGIRVLGTTPEALALDYLADIWGVRPDVRAVTSSQAQEILVAGAPMLAVTEAVLPLVPEEVSPDVRYSALGGRLIQIQKAPLDSLPAGGPAWREQPWEHDFGGVLRLDGGRVRRDAVTGETVVLLAWRARVGLTEDWSVSVRLTQGEKEVAQSDREHPVAGAYPFRRWSPGEVVGDAYTFTSPAEAPPDGVRVIVYRPMPDGTFTNLDIAWLPLQLQGKE